MVCKKKIVTLTNEIFWTQSLFCKLANRKNSLTVRYWKLLAQPIFFRVELEEGTGLLLWLAGGTASSDSQRLSGWLQPIRMGCNHPLNLIARDPALVVDTAYFSLPSVCTAHLMEYGVRMRVYGNFGKPVVGWFFLSVVLHWVSLIHLDFKFSNCSWYCYKYNKASLLPLSWEVI